MTLKHVCTTLVLSGSSGRVGCHPVHNWSPFPLSYFRGACSCVCGGRDSTFPPRIPPPTEARSSLDILQSLSAVAQFARKSSDRVTSSSLVLAPVRRFHGYTSWTIGVITPASSWTIVEEFWREGCPLPSPPTSLCPSLRFSYASAKARVCLSGFARFSKAFVSFQHTAISTLDSDPRPPARASLVHPSL